MPLAYIVIFLIASAIIANEVTPSVIQRIDQAKVESSITKEEALVEQIRRFAGIEARYPISVAEMVGMGYWRADDNDNGFGSPYQIAVDADKGLATVETTITNDTRREMYLKSYKHTWKPIHVGNGVVRFEAVLMGSSGSGGGGVGGAVAGAVISTAAPNAGTNTYWYDISGTTAVLKVSNGLDWVATPSGGGSGVGAVNVVGGGIEGLATSLPATGADGDIRYIADGATGVVSTYVYYNGSWYLYGTGGSGATVARALQLSTIEYAFGSIPRNSTRDLSITFSNPNATPSTQISAAISGASAFSIQSNTCGNSVPAYGSCAIKVRAMTNATPGAIAATLIYAGNAIPISGVVLASSTMVMTLARNTESFSYTKAVPLADGSIKVQTFVNTKLAFIDINASGALQTSSLTNTAIPYQNFLVGADNTMYSLAHNVNSIPVLRATSPTYVAAWSLSLTDSTAPASPPASPQNNLLSISATDPNVIYSVSGVGPGTAATGGAYVSKLTTTGTLLWKTKLVFGTTQGASIYKQQPTSDGGVLVAGTMYSNTTDTYGGAASYYAFLAKINTDGTAAWQRYLRLNSASSGQIVGLATDASGNIYVGYNSLSTYIFGGGYTNNYGAVIKLNSTGTTTAWAKQIYPDIASSGQVAYVINYESVIILITSKLEIHAIDATTGAFLFGKKLTFSPAATISSAAVDKSGNLILAAGPSVIKMNIDTLGLAGTYQNGSVVIADLPSPTSAYTTPTVVNTAGTAVVTLNASSVTTIANLTYVNDDATVRVTTETAGQ